MGCAIDPAYVRSSPGLKGNVLNKGVPVDGLRIIYSESYAESCDKPIGETVTDNSGYFRIPIDRAIQVIEPFPVGGCDYRGRICFQTNGGTRSWEFNITGKGEKEYHAGGSIVDEPLRLLIMTPKGSCKPPKWLNLSCDIGKEDKDMCHFET